MDIVHNHLFSLLHSSVLQNKFILLLVDAQTVYNFFATKQHYYEKYSCSCVFCPDM